MYEVQSQNLMFYKGHLETRSRNRGGLLLNAHNCHRNGSMIARVGANLDMLHGAVAFELSSDVATRKAHFEIWIIITEET